MASYTLTKQGIYYVLASKNGIQEYLYPISNAQISFSGESFGIGGEHGRNNIKLSEIEGTLNDDGELKSISEIKELFGINDSLESQPIIEQTKMYKFMGQEVEKIPSADAKGKRGVLTNMIVIGGANRNVMFTDDPTNDLSTEDNPIIRGNAGHFNQLPQIAVEDLRFKGNNNNLVYWVAISFYK